MLHDEFLAVRELVFYFHAPHSRIEIPFPDPVPDATHFVEVPIPVEFSNQILITSHENSRMSFIRNSTNSFTTCSRTR